MRRTVVELLGHTGFFEHAEMARPSDPSSVLEYRSASKYPEGWTVALQLPQPLGDLSEKIRS